MKTLKALIASPKSLSFFDQGIVSASNFFTLIYAGRQFNTEQFGFFSLAMLGVLFLANLQRALITRPMDLLGAAEPSEYLRGRLIALFGVLGVMAPIAIALLGAFSIKFFPQPELFSSCAAYLICFSLQEMMRRYWYAMNRIGYAVRSDLISYGGQVAALLAADALWGLNGSTAFLVMAASSLAAFLCDVRVSKLGAGTVSRSRTEVMTEHWSISKWLVLTVFAIWGAGQVYPLLVASLGPVAVATFAACGNILRGVSLVVQTVDNYLPSRAAALLHEKGAGEFRQHMMWTVSRSAAAGLVFALLIHVFADRIMYVVYGGTYDGAGSVLSLMVPGAFCGYLGAVLGAYSLAMTDSQASFVANLAATVCTFTVGFWLIITHGTIGAAIASSLTAVTSMVVQGSLVAIRLKAFERRTNTV
jgi:O-antigen/teichoic acid export membrane protein